MMAHCKCYGVILDVSEFLQVSSAPSEYFCVVFTFHITTCDQHRPLDCSHRDIEAAYGSLGLLERHEICDCSPLRRSPILEVSWHTE